MDTNVLISGVLFGGYPRRVLSAIVGRRLTACATVEIVEEYGDIVAEMIERKQGHIDRGILTPLIRAMEIIEPVSVVRVCRDPDDDRSIGCAKDAHALYIVSGDKDLLSSEHHEGIGIITAKDFCERYLDGQ